ncbi:MAG: 16S rRNA (guanine(966)-N(2))-methyltransferase RsmD [Candidatus Dojkabacteria bacterium]|nr:16S rRNA (guanine(966)-N(2))-methyltransferase RsmD [Candidatus Dojkabacteria bacterium]MDQ7020437.1 16S rRNA (guanine(966)-N(2))-methyltransferase RsmD [Candidatus Dojkabacteria bacterium]
MSRQDLIIKPRIISGEFKGTRLDVAVDITRPITDRVKKTMFDILVDITYLECLDLFAGSGSIGIEALSNGAKKVTFVDKSSDAIKVIKENINKLEIEVERFNVIKLDYNAFLNASIQNKERFDLIFIDPPFKNINRIKYDVLSELMDTKTILILKVETGKNDYGTLEKLAILDTRKIGKNTLIFYKKKESK